MSKTIQAIRGMNDLLPETVVAWRRVEDVCREVLAAYGYMEIRLPIVEKTQLFARSIGELTDIVEKEMYTFADRNGESLTLRPEGTAGCVRAGIENGLLRGRLQRYWYAGAMFRHERPQRGRYRQFHQIGAEAFGPPSDDLDAELILLTARIWRELGLRDLRLEINSLGTPETRLRYRDELVDYLEARRDQLDSDSVRRLQHNPLRILDSKNPDMQALIESAPRLLDHLDESSRRHFERVQQYMDTLGIEYHINARLVRGLDYYTHTVFEWTTRELGAQGTLCAGGRYDGLVEKLGGKTTPAAGFALGMERVVELMSIQGLAVADTPPDLYLAMLDEAAEMAGMRLAEAARDAGLQIHCNIGGGSLKSQMKQADKSGAQYVGILGEDELTGGCVTVKDLRGSAGQQSVPWGELTNFLVKQRRTSE